TLVTGAEIYSGLSTYGKKGENIGIKKILPIPPFPIKDISKEQYKILKELYDNGGSVNSVDELISIVNTETSPERSDYQKERARFSYHLKGLKKDGFIETEKQGKNVKVRLSKIGEIYVVGKG
ncbi:MAG: winged helix-turn-helix domain-containing protein, partial [Candidatus Hydrothermarchaeales archaeon]